MGKTAIEWSDYSWNPIRARNRVTNKVGWFCEHATPGCENCYAEGMNRRLGTGIDFKAQNADQVEIFLDEAMLLAPLRWKRPRMIFVCSMTDMFGRFITDEMIDRMFAVMALCPQHTFQVLTKRADRMLAYLISRNGMGNSDICRAINKIPAMMGNRHGALEMPLPNVWLGVSVEDQRRADERIPDLLATPAAIRFLSCEPLLSWLDIRWALSPSRLNIAAGFLKRGRFSPGLETLRPLDWIICGGESGPKARPMHADWARNLRDQGQTAGVPFYMKQMTKKAPIPDDLMVREMPRATVPEGERT